MEDSASKTTSSVAWMTYESSGAKVTDPSPWDTPHSVARGNMRQASPKDLPANCGACNT